jgi:hypothetical protein
VRTGPIVSGGWVHLDAGAFPDEGGKLFLVVELTLPPILPKTGILDMVFSCSTVLIQRCRSQSLAV